MHDARVLPGSEMIAGPNQAGEEEAVALQTFRLDPAVDRFARGRRDFKLNRSLRLRCMTIARAETRSP